MKGKLSIIICALALLTIEARAQIITFNKHFGYTDGSGPWFDNAGNVFQMSDSSFFTLSLSRI